MTSLPSMSPPRSSLLERSKHPTSRLLKAILSKQFSQATQVKVELEEAQREKARQREKNNETWKPVFFQHATGNNGKPELTEKGQLVLEKAQKAEWDLDGLL